MPGLDVDGASRTGRATKIVATLGPASADRAILRRMVEAGVDVVRLNFSHADHEAIAEHMRAVRAVQEATGRVLAVLGDLQGPKIRLGPLSHPLTLAADARIRLAVEAGHEGPDVLSCDYAELPRAVAAGDPIYLRDGTIELEVTGSDRGGVDAVVRRAGVVTGHDGVNVPGAALALPALGERDRADLRFAAEQGMDYVALSFVRRADDVREAQRLLRAAGSDADVIAKIETRAALEALDAIVEAAGGVMVARGDLGVEIGAASVPVWQHRIIDAARRRLVPSIVATEMLESMRERATPTRAEASDVAHAAWDGADAVMLSAESAIGEYPVETVAMMDRILREAESVHHAGAHDGADPGARPESAIAAAVDAMLRRPVSPGSRIGGVVAFTRSGSSARLIAAAHPRQGVLALTPDPRVRGRLALVRGVEAVLCAPPSSEAEMLASVDRESRLALGCAPGDLVVLVGALPIGRGTGTNFVALHRVGGDDATPPFRGDPSVD